MSGLVQGNGEGEADVTVVSVGSGVQKRLSSLYLVELSPWDSSVQPLLAFSGLNWLQAASRLQGVTPNHFSASSRALSISTCN